METDESNGQWFLVPLDQSDTCHGRHAIEASQSSGYHDNRWPHNEGREQTTLSHHMAH